MEEAIAESARKAGLLEETAKLSPEQVIQALDELSAAMWPGRCWIHAPSTRSLATMNSKYPGDRASASAIIAILMREPGHEQMRAIVGAARHCGHQVLFRIAPCRARLKIPEWNGLGTVDQGPT